MTDPTAGFPTYGTRKTSWEDVRKALRRCGAEESRVTGGHNNIMYAFPNGHLVATGKSPGAAKRSAPVMKEGLRQILSGVSAAGLDPRLFLAVLDDIGGVTWYQRPKRVTRLARFLRDERPPLDTPSDWKRALAAYAEWDLSLEGKEPYSEEKEEPMAEAQKHVPEAPPAPYGTADVMDLAGVPRGTIVRDHITAWIGRSMPKGRFIFGELIEKGDAHRIQREGMANMSNFFTEAGALAAAHFIQEKFADEIASVTPPKPEPEPEPEPTPAPPPPAPTPAPPPAAKPERVAARNGVMNVGQAVLRVCKAHDVEPVFNGYTIDLQATFIRMAEALE